MGLLTRSRLLAPGLLYGGGRRGGAGSAFDSDAEAIFASFTSPPDDTRKGLINTFVLALKSASIWTRFDVIYMFDAADSQAACINWKNPATFTATLINAPTFTADRGFTGNGSNTSIRSGFVPSTAGGNYVQDNAHVAGRSLSNAGASASNRLVGMVASPSAGRAGILLNDAGNCVVRVNKAIGDSVALATTLGHFIATRDDASNADVYHDGSLVGSPSHASAAVPDQGICFLSDVAVAFASLQIASASIGGHLDATQAAAFAAAELAYAQGVGAA